MFGLLIAEGVNPFILAKRLLLYLLLPNVPLQVLEGSKPTTDLAIHWNVGLLNTSKKRSGGSSDVF